MYRKIDKICQAKIKHVNLGMKSALTIGTLLRQLREAEGLLIREIGATLQIDPAPISKIERNDRLPTKAQLQQYISLFPQHAEAMYIAWLSDKVVYEIQDDNYALKAIKVAEGKIKYGAE